MTAQAISTAMETRTMQPQTTGISKARILGGRVLITVAVPGYLGGAVASNVRAGTPMFNLAFPVLFAVVIWAALVLRDKRLERVFFAGE